MRSHQKDEIKRRMSHGEILRLNTPDSSNVQNSQNGAGGVRNGASVRVANGFSNNPFVNQLNQSSSNSSSTSVNEYRNIMNDKPDYFKASVMVRSQSSSSNTSRWILRMMEMSTKMLLERQQLVWLNESMSAAVCVDLQNIHFVDTRTKQKF